MWIIALCVCLVALQQSEFVDELQSICTSLLKKIQSESIASPPEHKDKAEVSPPNVEPKIQKCYRLSMMPADWTPQIVLDTLTQELGEEIRSSQPQLSLYPSLDDIGQIGILKVTNTNSMIKKLVPNNATTQGIHLNGVNITLDTDFLGLTPLNRPSGKPVADIIAVTGLAGHAFGSWRSRETRQMWLQDNLASDLTGSVRILTFGYDSSLFANRDKEPDIMEYCSNLIQQLHLARRSDPERPLIFIGHSLGCIIIARVSPVCSPDTLRMLNPLRTMLMCLGNSTHTALFNASRGFFFFGAPHQGIRTKEMEAMLTDVLGPQAKAHSLLRQLREYSEFLEQQSEALGKVWEGKSIISFYEGNLSPTVKKSEEGTWSRNGEMFHLVRRTSSGLMIPEEVRIPVFENHRDMVKFACSTDVTYMKVIFHLQEMIDDIIS